MKRLYLGLLLTGFVSILLFSCQTDEQNKQYFQGKMQGEWRLNSIQNTSDNTILYSSDFHYPRIEITNNRLDWNEDHYSGSTTFEIGHRQEGTGEYEPDPFCDEEEDGPCCDVEIMEDVYYTTIEFIYHRNNSASLIVDPGKDSLVRKLFVRNITIDNSYTMYWNVDENGESYLYHFSR